MPAPGACPVRIAVVTAVLGTRDFVFTPPPQPCSEFFLFTNWTRVENANASRWTVVTPYPAFAARPRDRDGMPVPGPDGRNLRVLFSETWADAIAQIRLGFEAPTLTFQPEGAALYAGEPLPFDLASLGYTTELETEVARFQKLANVMAPRFVKLALLRIDVLSAFSHIVWADAGLSFDNQFVARARARFARDDAELLLFGHPTPNRTTVASEMHASVRAQIRLAALSHLFDAQKDAYDDSGFPDDSGMYWTALYGVRRTPRAARVLDAWWLELRRWVYRDQVSLPYALWRVETGGGPSDSAEGIGPPRIALEELDGEQALCAFLVGDADKCCRRCNVPKNLQGGGTSVGRDEELPDEILGLRRPATEADRLAFAERFFERYQERYAERRREAELRFKEWQEDQREWRRQNRTSFRKHMEWEARYEARRKERQESLRLWRQERNQFALYGKRTKDQNRAEYYRQKDEAMLAAGYQRRRRKSHSRKGSALGREQAEALHGTSSGSGAELDF